MNLHKKLFSFLHSKKENYILDTIDSEVKKTKKFGLDISKKDIELEKDIVVPIILEFWTRIEKAGNGEYLAMGRIVKDELFKRLEKQCRYYFEASKDKPVKNMYNCHITSLIDRLFLEINNDVLG